MDGQGSLNFELPDENGKVIWKTPQVSLFDRNRVNRVRFSRGLPTRSAANRAGRGRRAESCPPEKREAIEEALRHCGLI